MLKNGLLSIAGLAGLPSLARAVQDTTTPYNRPKLKISDIRTAEVRVHGYQMHVRIYTGADDVKLNPHDFGVDDSAGGFFGLDEESCSKPGSIQPSATGKLLAIPEASRQARTIHRAASPELKARQFACYGF